MSGRIGGHFARPEPRRRAGEYLRGLLSTVERRSWTGWYRHVTPSLFAHAVLTVIRARVAGPRRKPSKGGPG